MTIDQPITSHYPIEKPSINEIEARSLSPKEDTSLLSANTNHNTATNQEPELSKRSSKRSRHQKQRTSNMTSIKDRHPTMLLGFEQHKET